MPIRTDPVFCGFGIVFASTRKRRATLPKTGKNKIAGKYRAKPAQNKKINSRIFWRETAMQISCQLATK